MKTELTIEESAQLFELGVDVKMASKEKFFVGYNERAEFFDKIERLTGKRDFPKGVFQKREKRYANGPTTWDIYHKIFTLADLLSILPKEIKVGVTTYHLNIDYPLPDQVAARYIDSDDVDNDIMGVMEDELIDVLFYLLISAIKCGYITTNSNKK